MPRKPAKHPAKPKRGKKLEIEEPGVLYGRYSSHNQKDISVEQQFEKGYELAAEYGIRIIDTYADRAVSGRTDKRRDFQRMMTDAAKGKFRYVIAWKSNRMGRNMLEALINEARLQDLGVRVLYVEEDFDDTAAGRFAARSMMNVNQFYSENMAEDIKRGLYDNAANCMVANGHLPYGYKADETLHYAIDEPKAAVIREIFTRVSCGEAFVDIMASLNARGIKTSYGRPWGRSSFQKILSNERYRGIYIYGDVRKEDGIPRIISDELYFKVQEVITTKKNPQGRHRVNGDYLLTGKLFCGHCKSPMTGISGTSRSGNLHYYYVCQKRRTEKTCEKKNLRRDDIELQVAKAIKRRTLDDDTINWIADSVVEYSQHQESASGIGLLEDQLKDTQRSIKNLMAAIEQGIITPTTKARLMELEKEQSDIDRKITMAKADVIPVNRDQLVGWLKKLQAGDVHDKKYQAELFDTFLIAVYVYDTPDGQDYMKVVFNYAGSKNTVEIPLDPSVIDNVENIETGAVRLSSAQVHQNRENQQSVVIAGFSLFINALQRFWKALQCEKRRGFTIVFRIIQAHFANKMLTKMLTACGDQGAKPTAAGALSCPPVDSAELSALLLGASGRIAHHHRHALDHINTLGARVDYRDILPIGADASAGIPHCVGLAPKLAAGISAAIAAILDNLIHDTASVSLVLISAGLLPADGVRPGTAYAVAQKRANAFARSCPAYCSRSSSRVRMLVKYFMVVLLLQ